MKKPQNNKQSQILPKTHTLSNYLSDLPKEAFMAHPGKTEWRERLIYTLCHWLYTTDGMEKEEFLFEYKIPRGTFYMWRDQYEDIQKAVTEVKVFLASRRRVGVMKKKLEYSSAYRNMHEYDPEWKKVDEYHNNLKIDVQKEAKADLTNQGIPFVVTRCLGECSHKEEKVEDNE